MAQNLALSLFKILYSQDRFYMKSLEFKKKVRILSGVFNLSFTASSPFTSQVHQSCVTLVWSHDLLWKPLEQALCMWLGTCQAESLLLRTLSGCTTDFSFQNCHKGQMWGHLGHQWSWLGLSLQLLLSPNSSGTGQGNWRVTHLGKQWCFLTVCSWLYSLNCVIHCLIYGRALSGKTRGGAGWQATVLVDQGRI